MPTQPLTLGIEEEYLLLDPATGAPMSASSAVRRRAAGLPALDGDDVEPELLQAQVEVSTPVCTSLDEAGGHLLRLRSEVSRAAEQVGCTLASVGAASRFGERLPDTSEKDRYRAMHHRAPRLVDEMLLNGMHVHVGIDDEADRVRVLNGLRPWLPVLTALAANSPFWAGSDSGFASWRTVHFARWPISGPPPVFADPADYERRVAAVIGTGALVDRGQLYWQARLSERYPTVEIRVADVQLSVADSTLIAGLLRGLVLHQLQEPAGQQSVPAEELLRTAVWQAARDELTATLLDPISLESRPADEVVAALLARVRPALQELGDERQVSSLLAARSGTGAARQRVAYAEAGFTGVRRLIEQEFLG